MFSFLYNNIIYNEIEYFTFLNIWLIILFIYIFIYLYIINITLLFLSTIKLNNNYIELINTLFSIIFLLIIISPALLILLEIDINILPSIVVNVLSYQWSWSFNVLINKNIISYDINSVMLLCGNWDSQCIECILDGGNNVSSTFIRLFFINSVFNEIIVFPRCEFYIFDFNNYLLIPLYSCIKFYLIGIDVIHSFGLYTLGIKIDCIPGRINLTVINKLLNKGEHRGFCYELCGNGHSVMLLVSLSI